MAPHADDIAARIITEAASSNLDVLPRQPDFESMVDNLGQAMGLLSGLAYSLYELQNPDGSCRARFQRAFVAGLETAKGIRAMTEDPAVT